MWLWIIQLEVTGLENNWFFHVKICTILATNTMCTTLFANLTCPSIWSWQGILNSVQCSLTTIPPHYTFYCVNILFWNNCQNFGCIFLSWTYTRFSVLWWLRYSLLFLSASRGISNLRRSKSRLPLNRRRTLIGISCINSKLIANTWPLSSFYRVILMHLNAIARGAQ